MAQGKNGTPKPTTGSTALDALQTLEALAQQIGALRAQLEPSAAAAAFRVSDSERIRERLQEALRREQVSTEQALARALGVTAATVHHHVHVLAREGKVVLRKVWSDRGRRWIMKIYDASAVAFADEPA